MSDQAELIQKLKTNLVIPLDDLYQKSASISANESETLIKSFEDIFEGVFKTDGIKELYMVEALYTMSKYMYLARPEFMKYVLAHLTEWLQDEENLYFMVDIEKQKSYIQKSEKAYDDHVKATSGMITSGFKVKEQKISELEEHILWLGGYTLKEILKFTPQPIEKPDPKVGYKPKKKENLIMRCRNRV